MYEKHYRKKIFFCKNVNVQNGCFERQKSIWDFFVNLFNYYLKYLKYL